MEKKKIFAVADIHGYFSALKSGLERAGFEKGNDEHLLVVCGDCFDRGNENKRVLEYLYSIPNKVIVRGNHEELLLRALANSKIEYNDERNGTDITVKEFFGRQNVTLSGFFLKNAETEKLLKDFIASTRDYFETENHVFIHGWLPLNVEEGWEKWRTAWRDAPYYMWYCSRYSEWMHAYSAGYILENKRIVCGHRASVYACMIDKRRGGDDFSPYVNERVMAMDSGTFRTGRVNVKVFEDNVYPVSTHVMHLEPEYYALMLSGEKRIEVRLNDEKRRKIAVGDKVKFNENGSDRSFFATVTGRYVYNDATELFEDLSQELHIKKAELTDALERIYGQSAVEMHGLCALRISV